MIATSEGESPIEQVKAGDWVNTPLGRRRVLRSHASGMAQICRVEFNNGTSLSGTPNHQIFIAGQGMISLATLKRQTIVKTCQKLKSTESENTPDTTGGVITNRGEGVSRFTAKRGLTPTDQFRTASMFTIWTMILTTILWQIFASWMDASTRNITQRKGKKTAPCKLHKLLGRLLLKVVKPSASTVRRCERIHPSGNWRALIVASLLKQDTLARNAALKNVPKNAGRWPTHKPVSSAETSSTRHPMLAENQGELVVTNVVGNCGEAMVYNLTVEGAHLYYANGVLSSNTDAPDHGWDAVRYGLQRKHIRAGRVQTNA